MRRSDGLRGDGPRAARPTAVRGIGEPGQGPTLQIATDARLDPDDEHPPAGGGRFVHGTDAEVPAVEDVMDVREEHLARPGETDEPWLAHKQSAPGDDLGRCTAGNDAAALARTGASAASPAW
jgi:hypothetical protein